LGGPWQGAVGRHRRPTAPTRSPCGPAPAAVRPARRPRARAPRLTHRPRPAHTHATRIVACPRKFAHDWRACPFAHAGERARRRPLGGGGLWYSSQLCAAARGGDDGGAACPNGSTCGFAHNVFESHLHPERFRTQLCHNGPGCTRPLCFFAHSGDELRAPLSGDCRAPGRPAAAKGATAAPPLTAAAPPPAAASGAGSPVPVGAAAAAAAGATPPPSFSRAPSSDTASSDSLLAQLLTGPSQAPLPLLLPAQSRLQAAAAAAAPPLPAPVALACAPLSCGHLNMLAAQGARGLPQPAAAAAVAAPAPVLSEPGSFTTAAAALGDSRNQLGATFCVPATAAAKAAAAQAQPGTMTTLQPTIIALQPEASSAAPGADVGSALLHAAQCLLVERKVQQAYAAAAAAGACVPVLPQPPYLAGLAGEPVEPPACVGAAAGALPGLGLGAACPSTGPQVLLRPAACSAAAAGALLPPWSSAAGALLPPWSGAAAPADLPSLEAALSSALHLSFTGSAPATTMAIAAPGYGSIPGCCSLPQPSLAAGAAGGVQELSPQRWQLRHSPPTAPGPGPFPGVF
jgi:hypothetical protein